jgi:hypothetical protein
MSDRLGSVRSQVTGFFSSGDDNSADLVFDPHTGEIVSASGVPVETTPAIATGPVNVDLREIVRFDLTPRMIMQRWPRVSSSVSSDGRLDGLRVPLVTGTGPHDLAGSLTYYFDKSQQMQRLTFQGYTGDERYVVSVVTQHYQLKPEPAVGAGVFVSRWNNKPTSALWVRRMHVVNAASHHQKFEVMLELNKPSNYVSLSPQFENLLRHANAQHEMGPSVW